MRSGKRRNFTVPISTSDGADLMVRCGGRTDWDPSMRRGAAFTSKSVAPSTVFVDACHLNMRGWSRRKRLQKCRRRYDGADPRLPEDKQISHSRATG